MTITELLEQAEWAVKTNFGTNLSARSETLSNYTVAAAILELANAIREMKEDK